MEANQTHQAGYSAEENHERATRVFLWGLVFWVFFCRFVFVGGGAVWVSEGGLWDFF